MRVGKCCANLPCPSNRCSLAELLPELEMLLQRLAFEHLEHQARSTVRGLKRIDDAGHMGRVDSVHRFGFLLQTRPAERRLSPLRLEDLDRVATATCEARGLIEDAEPSATDTAIDAIGAPKDCPDKLHGLTLPGRGRSPRISGYPTPKVVQHSLATIHEVTRPRPGTYFSPSAPVSPPTQARVQSLQARRLPLAKAPVQHRTLAGLFVEDFSRALDPEGLWPLRPTKIETLQINVGKLCNQTCRHCHVDAGPDRTEIMTPQTAELCVDVLRRFDIPIVDITGGAPELNPSFRWLVEQCASLGRHVIDRCNLTILETGAHRDLPEFLAAHDVEIICSLPHYDVIDTDAQRGDGVFEKSIRALKRLNALGYGQDNPQRRLVLVTNPVGATLPGLQCALEATWKRELAARHGIRFDALYTITNMPISRHLEWLIETSNLEGYMQRLVQAFNPEAAQGVMCRNTLSVGWDGTLYDCDFNQMLDMPVAHGAPQHLRDFDLERLHDRTIMTGQHCFGCTAGAGSSCGGSVAG